MRICRDGGVDSSKERKTKSLLEMLTEGRKTEKKKKNINHR